LFISHVLSKNLFWTDVSSERRKISYCLDLVIRLHFTKTVVWKSQSMSPFEKLTLRQAQGDTLLSW
jgi:hypothetical protein